MNFHRKCSEPSRLRIQACDSNAPRVRGCWPPACSRDDRTGSVTRAGLPYVPGSLAASAQCPNLEPPGSSAIRVVTTRRPRASPPRRCRTRGRDRAATPTGRTGPPRAVRPAAPHRAEPAERGGMPIDHRHDACAAGQWREQGLHVGRHSGVSGPARTLRRTPTAVEAVRRRHGEEAGTWVRSGDCGMRLDCLRRDTPPRTRGPVTSRRPAAASSSLRRGCPAPGRNRFHGRADRPCGC